MNDTITSKRLFVGDLANRLNENDIESIFRDEGFHVVGVKIMRGKQSLTSLCYGFVHLKSHIEAVRAIQCFDSKLIHGRRIKVRWAQPNVKENKNADHLNSIYVRFRALRCNSEIVTEETLRSLFSAFGIVTDVSVKTNHSLSPAELQSGYAFVHFDHENGLTSSIQAINAFSNNPVIQLVEYQCEASQNLSKLLNSFQQQANYVQYESLESNIYTGAMRNDYSNVYTNSRWLEPKSRCDSLISDSNESESSKSFNSSGCTTTESSRIPSNVIYRRTTVDPKIDEIRAFHSDAIPATSTTSAMQALCNIPENGNILQRNLSHRQNDFKNQKGTTLSIGDSVSTSSFSVSVDISYMDIQSFN